MITPTTTLHETLRLRNVALVRDCEALKWLLAQATIPTLLEPYRQAMVKICDGALHQTQNNLALLQHYGDTVQEEVLSKTRAATTILRLLSSRLATPIVRGGNQDTLCLKILHWLHQTHPQTQKLPFAYTSGDIAVQPFIELAPIYAFPELEQGGLLYQPLHFHEFGHVLYRLHKPEIDDLIKEIQEMVERKLLPLSDHSDSLSNIQAEKRERVISRWFYWAQEFFCDAVGFTLGGPAYLYAFSAYCGSLSVSDFTLSLADLERSKHPTHGLRIRLLIRRAREAGFLETANHIEAEWEMLARELGITFDFHGFYEESMEDEVYRFLSDMLIVVAPRSLTLEEVAADRDPQLQDTPVLLVNRAWNIYHARMAEYADWEQQAIQRYLA